MIGDEWQGKFARRPSLFHNDDSIWDTSGRFRMDAVFLIYLSNCFWLIFPVLVLNMLLARRLPRFYQAAVFDNVPNWIAAGENILRIVVFLAPIPMPLGISDGEQKLGLILYAVGFAIYLLSWLLQIRFPNSAWSRSRLGFMAPAYTPALWLAGIALTGRSLFLPVPWSPWIYAALGTGFLVFHNTHCWIAHSCATPA